MALTDSMMMEGETHSAESLRYQKQKKGAWGDWLADELEADENGWDLNEFQLKKGKTDAAVNWADPRVWEKAKFTAPARSTSRDTATVVVADPTCESEEFETESCSWADLSCDSEEEFCDCDSNETDEEEIDEAVADEVTIQDVALEVRNALSGETICIAELRLCDVLDKLRSVAACELKCPCSYVQLLDGHRILDLSETLQEAGLGNGSIVNVLRRPCFLLTCSADNTAKLWDTVTGECFRTLSGHTGKVYSAVPSPDNQLILTSSGDGTVRLWVTETGDCVLVLNSGHGSVLTSSMAPDGEHIAAGTESGAVLVWSTTSGECKFAVDAGDGMPVRKVDYSPDGRFILTASGSWDCGTTKVWDAETGENISLLCSAEDIILDANYSPDGSSIVTGCGDDTVMVWNAESGELQLELEGHDGAVYASKFSPNGRHILTGSSDCTAKLWGAKSSRCLSTLEGHEREVSSVSFSPDGALVVTGSMDNTARIWATKGGVCQVVMEGHTSAILGVHFSKM